MSKVKTIEEAVQRYGVITPETSVNGTKVPAKWANEFKWMDVYNPPQWFTDRVHGMDGKPCKRIYMNKDLHEPFSKALENVKSRGLEAELKTFDGCFNIRFVRGSKDSPSTHTYGLAVDLNAAENPLGKPGLFSDELGKCFEDAGFTWGRHFKRQDSQHFSYAWE